VRVRTIVASEILLLVGLLAVVVAAWLVERGFGLDQPLALATPALVAIAAAPGVLWLGYFHSHDRHEPIPKHHVVATYLVGAFLAGPVAAWLIAGLSPTHPATAPDLDPLSLAHLCRAFLVIAVVQEVAKYAVVRYGVYRTAELDQPLDALVYMTAAGLGYAGFLTYRELGAGGEAFLSAAVARSVVTALAHACFAAIVGYALGVAKFAPASVVRRALWLLGGLAIAVVLDGQFVVVSGILATRGLEVTPWRVVAYAFGFAAAAFIAASLLIRRLVALVPRAVGGAR
jgi:RsiW-degrading membrane proteinase PrsW (M82 family)